MGNDKVLSIILKAQDLASGTIAAVGKQVKALGDQATGMSQSISSGATKLGGSMETTGKSIEAAGAKFLPFSVAAGAALGLSTKAAIDFNQQMEYLHTQAGLSQKDVDGLKDKVLALAPAVGQGPDKLAEAFYHIASAGNGIWSTKQMLDMLKLSAEGAAVGNADLDSTVYSLTSTMSSNIAGAKTATETMANLNAIVGAGDMRFQDLNAAISTGIMSTAATFGVDIRSMGTALATLTDNGEHADEASTRLRMSLALMAAPSRQAAKLLGDIGLKGPEVTAATEAMTKTLQKAGLTTVKLSQDLRQPNGIMVALEDLKTHLEKSGLSADAANALLSKSFGGGRTDAAMLTMLQNLDRMNEKYKLIGQNATKFGEAWSAQQQTAAQKLAEFKAQLEALSVKLGNALLPAITALVTWLSKMVDAFERLSPAQKKMLEFAAIMIALVGPIMSAVGAVMSFAGALLAIGAPVAIAMGGVLLVAAAAATLVLFWKPISNFFKKLWDDVVGFFRSGSYLTVAVSLPFIGVPFTIMTVYAKLANFFMNLYNTIVGHTTVGIARTSNIWLTLLTIPVRIMGAFNPLIGFFAHLADTIAGSLGNIGGVKAGLHSLHIPGFASGVQNFGGGLAVVGEQGPELVSLPRGANVYPAGQTAQMLGGGGGNVTLNVNIGTYAGEPGELRTVATKIYQELQRVARSNGQSLPNIGIRST